MKLIVTGSRDWPDCDAVASELAYLLLEMPQSDGEEHLVVHGGCQSGADNDALEFCARHGINQEINHPDWTKHGKAAGPMRNREMAEAGADLCLAFWDGISRGTASMISEATKCGVPVRIVPRRTR